jgi:ADP-ribose pyrophosphatase YjhB (NUDIX family)
MRLLKSTIHQDIESLQQPTLSRIATRAIVLKGEMILMLYTARYHDYTLPGGGLDEGEELVAGMIRELQEETGATNIRDIHEFGLYEEFRPWYKDDVAILHMKSYCYTCVIDSQLGATKLEDYEIKNGMKPVWLNIYDAIEHNEKTIKNSAKKGMSIQRETYLLKLICKELLTRHEQYKAG